MDFKSFRKIPSVNKEEVAWEGRKEKVSGARLVDVSHLLQPGRLQNILSREERYTRDYPNTLGKIAKLYVEDLENENAIPVFIEFKCLEDEIVLPDLENLRKEKIKEIKRSLGKNLYRFIRSQMENLE